MKVKINAEARNKHKGKQKDEKDILGHVSNEVFVWFWLTVSKRLQSVYSQVNKDKETICERQHVFL